MSGYIGKTLPEGPVGHAVLITYPGFGTLWMENPIIEKGYVHGRVWDSGGAGSSLMPDDYMGEYDYMNFPVGCIKKVGQP